MQHKEATVGDKAPLTLRRDETQAKLDQINGSYRDDKGQLESQINNVQQSLGNDARKQIDQARQDIKAF